MVGALGATTKARTGDIGMICRSQLGKCGVFNLRHGWPELAEPVSEAMEFWEDPLTWIGVAIGFLAYRWYRYFRR